MGGKTKAKWYAVHRGRAPGVYRTWAEAEPLVKGFAGARYKGFATEAEARAFVAAAPSLASVAAHNAAARMAMGGAASTSTPTAAASGSGSTASDLLALCVTSLSRVYHPCAASSHPSLACCPYASRTLTT
jgi:hypothetical protein